MTTPPADALQGAITHDNQTEGYLIVSGGGIAFIDGTLVNGRHSTNNPDGGPNGPGCGGGVAVGSRKVELKVGDVLIVPPGVIHGWYDIPDHVDDLSFRPSHGVMKNGWVNPLSPRSSSAPLASSRLYVRVARWWTPPRSAPPWRHSATTAAGGPPG